MSNRILLPSKTIEALNKAAYILKDISHGRYEIVLTRGYISWGRWRCFKGILAKKVFCFLYGEDQSDAELLFSSNGHDDGLSVDIQLYDATLHKVLTFLCWRNVIMARTQAENIFQNNRNIFDMIDKSMATAGFIVHPDPREKLQMHYRLRE